MKGLWIAAAALAAMLSATGAQAQGCGLTKVAAYEMLPTDTGHIVIKLKIGDQEELMAVDTGAWFSYIVDEVADDMKLPRRSMSDQFVSYDAYGRKTSEVATAPSIDIGPLQVKSVDFVVAPRGTNFGGGVRGLLGMNVLKNFDLDFDFANKTLNLFSQEHCPGQVVYWASYASRVPFKFDQSSIKMMVQLDGKELLAELDTGAPYSTISMPIANQAFDLTPSSPGVKKHEYERSDGSAGVSYTYVFKALIFGGMTVPYPTLHLLPDKMGQAANADNSRRDYTQVAPVKLPAILLGLEEMHHLHVYVSFKEKLMYVTAADAH